VPGPQIEKGVRRLALIVSEILVDITYINDEVIAEMENAGIDASGEEGEYHTVVTNGPIFHDAVVIKPREHILRKGYCFLDISVISTDD